MSPLAQIWDDILRERSRQERLKAAGKFEFSCADDGLNDYERYSILGEEFGEVGHELNEGIPGGHADIEKLRTELIQVAAVAVAWVEHIDKQIAEHVE